jgi:ABC-type antimicrobial peptide transport system permease subunit
LVVFAVLAVAAGVVAAALPARRAARMDVLSALAHE